MKTSIFYTIIGLLMINTLSAQVKIGNNPQNLNAASILELESSNRVLVITRVTNAQMNTINPLRGALVYNTDEECIHYFNGTGWVNICEELDNSFTVSTRADYLGALNPNARDSTVVITTSTNLDDSVNYNFEVGQITGANIIDRTVNGDKIVNSSITGIKLQNRSITTTKLEDGVLENDLFVWKGNAWTITNSSELEIIENDGIIGNEVVNATLNGSLTRNGEGTEDDPYTLDVKEKGINTDELEDGAVTEIKLDKESIPLSGFAEPLTNVSMGNLQINNLENPTFDTDAVNLQTLNTAIANSEALDDDTDDNNEIQNIEEVLADGNNANGTTITGLGTPTAATDAATKGYVDALDGTDDQDLGIGAGGTPNQSVELTITDGTSATIDIRDADSDITNEIQNIEEVLADGNNANGTTITGLGTPTAATDAATKGYVDALDGTDDQDLGIGAGGTPNQSVELTITDGTSATIDIRDADSDITNEIQNIEEVLADGNNANGTTITGLGTPTAATDAATKGYVDALDGTDDQDLGIGAGGTPNQSVELTITDGTSATIDIRDADSDITNEIQNIEEVLADGNNANGTTITGLGTPTAATDAATKGYVDAITEEIILSGQVAAGTSTSIGEYTITDVAITTTSIIQLTVEENPSGDPIIIQLASQNNGDFSVKIYEFTGGAAPTLTDANWQYIVVNP
ncbi:hypothetical protein [Flagellimonas sp. GZD32]|uniref:hypothetical protein n=1 Tax=Flagellimonas cixiensis TaxID=3228750 RepID=UPI0035C90F45